MICPFCKEKTDGVNHNNRGLRCTSCWALLPDLPEPTLVQAESEFEGEGFVANISDILYDKLHGAGYRTVDDICDASDEELLAIHGIGKVALTQIRVVLGGDPA